MTDKRHAPATLRNREAIAQVLAQELPQRSARVLEIASGTGEHAVFLAQHFAQHHWQPSDPDTGALASIAAYRDEYAGANLAAPVMLDAAAPASWPLCKADAILCINMVHISEWAATIGLFRGAADLLINEAPIILYGPYLEEGVETAASNLEFDYSLKARNPAWGLRRLDDVDRVASEYGFERTSRYEMPANNLTVIYRKRSP